MILLVGYGNTLRGDDGLGPALVERLAASSARTDLQVITCQQLTPELALTLASRDVKGVLFADAGVQAIEQGVEFRRMQPATPQAAIGHFGDPSVLLFLAERLYGRCPPAWMITMPGSDFAFGTRLSPAGQEILDEAQRKALALLAELSWP